MGSLLGVVCFASLRVEALGTNWVVKLDVARRRSPEVYGLTTPQMQGRLHRNATTCNLPMPIAVEARSVMGPAEQLRRLKTQNSSLVSGLDPAEWHSVKIIRSGS